MEPINPNRTRIVSVSVFSALFALGMALTTWRELTLAPDRPPLEIIYAIIHNAQAVSVGSAGFAAIVEAGGYIMLLAAHIIQKEQEKAMAKGRGEGLVEGRAEGRAEGRDEGRDEAYKDADEQLDAYFRRMDAAREAGVEFNEPRPRFRRNGR